MHRLQNVVRLWLIFGYIFCSISVSAQASFRLLFLREPVQQLFLQQGRINQLDCVYDNALGQVTHSWYLNDLLVDDQEYIQDFPNGTLRFEIGEDDHTTSTSTSSRQGHFEGLYRCCISRGSQALCSPAANVLFPTLSSVAVIPSTSNGVLGETLRLVCDTRGNPKPVVTWFKDTYLLQDDDRRLILLTNTVIQIASVTASDAGVYVCSARNMAGLIGSTPTIITVNENTESSLDSSSRGDILNMTATDVVGRIGEDILLECLVKNNNNVAILWTYNGTQHIPEARGERLGMGNLLIKNAVRNDSGNYTCTSIHDLDDSLTTKKINVRLTVQVPPTFVQVPEKLMVKSEGFNAVFYCQSMGVPTPDVIWYRNGLPLTLGGRFSQKYTSTLWAYNLDPAKDIGLYQCFASNPLGTIYVTSFLHINGSLLEAVGDLRATNVTNSSVVLSWQLPEYGLEVLGIIVYYAWIPDGDEYSTYIHISNKTLWNEKLGKLRPNSNYSLSVRVVFGGFMSKLSTIYTKTRESAPSAAPVILDLLSTPTSITVTWKHLVAEHQNGVLTKTVVCIDQEADNINSHCYEVDPVITSYTFNNLHPGQEYLVRLAAKTGQGQGPFSDKEPRITPIGTDCTVPAIVPIKIKLVNSSFVSFTWGEPNNSQSGPILGYRLMIYKAVDGNRVDFLSLDAKVRGYNKSNAGWNKVYTVTFYAIGQCGEGPSTTSVITMPEITVELNIPHNLAAIAMSADRIRLSWDAPSMLKKPLSYTVDYEALGESASHVTGRYTEVMLLNLSPYTIYQMKVTAHFADSTCTSQLLYCRTLESIPGSPPHQLGVYLVDSTSLNVTWLPPTVPNGKITHYTIAYCSISSISQGWQTISVPVREDRQGLVSVVLVNLDSSTEYTIKISASTSIGPGPSTILFNAKTPLAARPATSPTDLRSGILTGVCLALLCITVCVSLLVYHHRQTLCYHDVGQGHSVSARIGTPSHARGCHESKRKEGCPCNKDYHLSILPPAQFEMEHLMMGEGQAHVADRRVLRVHGMEPVLPVRGANMDDLSPAEEPFLVIHHREPPQEDTTTTSQDIPHCIPQDDSGDPQSTSVGSISCCEPEIDHYQQYDRKPQTHRICTRVKIDVISDDDSAPFDGDNDQRPTTSQKYPTGHHDRRRCEMGEAKPEMYSSPSPATLNKRTSLLADTLATSTTAPQESGQRQTSHLRGEHLRDFVSKSHNKEVSDGGPSCDYNSDTSSLGGDSGLSADLFGDENGGCDTSPDFLERVLEELSWPVY